MHSPPPYTPSNDHPIVDSIAAPHDDQPTLSTSSAHSSNPIVRAVRSFPFKMFEKRSPSPIDEKSSHPEDLDRSVGQYHIGGTAEMLSDKAAESLRYVTIQKESHDARHDDDSLKHELKGKKVWRVGGVGIWAYEKEDKFEERKKEAWRDWSENHGKDEWLKAARARTNMYNDDSHGVKPLLKWKLVERGGNLPDDAIPIGHEANGAFLYACRAWWEGGVHPGKAGAHLINKASISYGGSEHTLDIYEVLCGPSDPTLLQWRSYNHGEQAAVDGWQPVEGGREKDGKPLFIAKGQYENGVHPGKCQINDDHACIGFGGGELWVRPFQVLAYCSPDRR